MSTYGKRNRTLVDIKVWVERSFDDFDGDVAEQVNQPAFVVRFNRLEITIARRPHRWMWAPTSWNFKQFGTPWFYGEIFLEKKDSDPDYTYSGDWYEGYHDRLVR